MKIGPKRDIINEVKSRVDALNCCHVFSRVDSVDGLSSNGTTLLSQDVCEGGKKAEPTLII